MTLRKGDGTADVLVEGRGANLSLPLSLQKNTVTVLRGAWRIGESHRLE